MAADVDGRPNEHRSLRSRPGEGLDRIRIVLVEPRTPGNIGAACRAARTMGIGDVVVVSGRPFRHHPEARMLAHGALDLLENARRVTTLREALDGVHWVVGTTHRRRARFRDLALPIDRAARQIAEWTATRTVAVLFGREECGLLDEEIAVCRVVTSIPTAGENPSLNLAQAIMVVVYEIFRAGRPRIEGRAPDFAEAWELEPVYERMFRAMDVIEFRPIGDDPDKFIRAMKRVFSHARLERRDVRTLHRICQQIEFFARKYRAPNAPPHRRKPEREEDGETLKG